MKTILLTVLAVAFATASRADFSYTTTTKMTGGMLAGMAGQKPQTTVHLLKGDKLKMDSGDSTSIMDFTAQTYTTFHHADKTYRVTPFAELGKAVGGTQANLQIDVKETGQTRVINGLKARQVIMTMDVDSPQAQGMKMTMTMDMWISPDVPGGAELKAFYARNAAKFPWAAMASGGSAKQQAQMAEMAKKMASLGGIPLVQVMKMTSAGGAASGADVKAQMSEACAKFAEMKKQGGPMAQMAEKYESQMGCKQPGGASGALMEATTESSGFSSAAIAASEFTAPAGFTLAK